MIEIRAYEPADKKAVINLIRLNTPAYFAPEEEKDFDEYLDSKIEWYYVLLDDGEIVGSGGLNFAENKTIARISWDIIHPSYQGRSLGKRLLRYRIERVKSIGSVQKLTVRTSQFVYKFYEKQGFILHGIQKDYWAKGFDLYSMEYRG